MGPKAVPNRGPGLGDRKMSATQLILIIVLLPIALLIIWNIFQSRRIDQHEQRIKALESKQ